MTEAHAPIPFGKYRLIRRLGAGGMAEAFLAKTEGPGGFEKILVVKRMLPHIADDENAVAMFHREAKVAALLTHTNVVQIFELGTIEGVHFIAMEYVDGAALDRLARATWDRGKSIPLEAICCAIADASLGLSAAHELCGPDGKPLGVVHRDVSPDNLIMNREGVTKLLDFGVAKLANAELTRTGAVKGKIPFLAPECIEGGVVEARSDLFALGVSFYWLITGRRPFVASTDHALMRAILVDTPEPPRRLNVHIPDVIDKLVLRLLAKDPRDRPASGVEVHDALAATLATRRAVAVPFIREALATGLPKVVGDRELTAAPATPLTDALMSWELSRTEVAPAPAPAPPPKPHPFSVADTVLVEETVKNAPFAAMPATLLNSAAAPASPRRSSAPLLAAGSFLLLAGIVAFLVLGGGGTQELGKDGGRAVGSGAGDGAGVVGVGVDRPLVEPEQMAGQPRQMSPQGAPAEPERVMKPVRSASSDGGQVAPASPAPSHGSSASPPSDQPTSPPRAADSSPRISISARAPTGIAWQIGGRTGGTGNTTLLAPPGTKAVVAVDARREGRSTVPVQSGIADYNDLPHGKINPRAGPYADVFLGQEPLGTTPFAPVEVPVGKYTLRFVYKGREERRSVEVKANETVRVKVDFEP